MGSGVFLSICPGASSGVGQAGAEVGASRSKKVYTKHTLLLLME